MIKHLKDNRKLFASKETLTCIRSTDTLMGCYTTTPGMYVVQSSSSPSAAYMGHNTLHFCHYFGFTLIKPQL